MTGSCSGLQALRRGFRVGAAHLLSGALDREHPAYLGARRISRRRPGGDLVGELRSVVDATGETLAFDLWIDGTTVSLRGRVSRRGVTVLDHGQALLRQ